MNDRALPRGTVAVVGPGRVGTVLAAALRDAGHRISAAAGGSDASRRRFAARFPGASTAVDPVVTAGANLVVVATPDDAVAEAVAGLVGRADAVGAGQRVVHVAGSLGLSPLRPARLAGARVAACHPAQTVPSADADPAVLHGAAWAVTAAPGDRGWARALVRQVGGVPVDVADDRRGLYHAALVVASNAVGAAVSVARQLALAARIRDPATVLEPLVRASVEHALAQGALALTGPVVRGDVGTLRRHLARLSQDAPELAAAYRALNEVVLQQARPGLDPHVARAVRDTLAAGGEGR